MKGGSSFLALLLAGLTKHVESDAGGEVFLGSHAVDRFLHLAVSAIATLHRIGGGGKQRIVQESQRLLQVGSKELLQGAADLPEATDPLTEPGQFGQRGVGAAAAQPSTFGESANACSATPIAARATIV